MFFLNFKIGHTYGSQIIACYNCTHELSNKEGSFKETYMLKKLKHHIECIYNLIIQLPQSLKLERRFLE